MPLLNTFVSLLALGAAVAEARHPVTGAPVANGQNPPYRLEINTLQKNGGAAWDLYIQSLEKMFYGGPTSDLLSWFQLAGIHGAPFIEWDGGGARAGNGWLGYCPHNEQLFAPWHKPYLMLIEQTLVATAQSIAATYPSAYRAQYQAAANTLRLPYWDWALDSNVPGATVSTTMTINVPNGNGLKKSTIENPLWRYRYPKAAMSGQYGTWNPEDTNFSTSKCAKQGYPGQANTNMASRPYRSWTYDAITRATSFAEFATTGMSGGGPSLEQIHNGVHYDAGCQGQFLDATWSGFDPIFWMHHAQVDRIWAYWQILKPNQATFGGSYKGGSRWATPDGATITPDTPLYPFIQSNGQYHTTKSVRSARGTGYIYQGLEYWSKSDNQMRSDVTKMLNSMYGSGTAAQKRALETRSNTVPRYFVALSFLLEEVPRPANIGVFVGGKNAGAVVAMMQPTSGQVNFVVPLDQGLEDADIDSNHVANTIATIQKTIKVVINGPNGQYDVSKVPSLVAQLESVNMTLPASNTQLPTFGQTTVHNVVTNIMDNMHLKVDVDIPGLNLEINL